jgi:hypothetical protein
MSLYTMNRFIKIMFALEQAIKAQRGNTGMALLFL